MGARIEFTFEHKEFSAALARMTLTPPVKAKLMRALSVGLLHSTRDRFATSTTPSGSHWQALKPWYAAIRRPDRILMQARGGGGLLGSLTSRVQGNQVVVGSNKVYAAVHQFGATIVPVNKPFLVFRGPHGLIRSKRVVIPPRPYLGFGPADEREALDALDVLMPGGR